MANSMKLYETEMEVLLELPDEQRNHIITAIICNCLGKDIPKLDPTEKGLYMLIMGQVKRAENLSNKRKQNVNSRWKNDTKSKFEDINVIQNDTTLIQNDTKSEIEDTNAYTNTNTNTITHTNTYTMGESEANGSPPPHSKPKFQKFGEYSHVKLTQEQYQKLIADFGEAITAEYIRRCDEYQQQTGKNYKDYNLTIRHWIDKDGGIKSVQAVANKSKYTNPYDVPLYDD